MYKALFRTPFQHAMLALWLFGMVRLLGSLAHAPPDGKWVITAALASLLLVLIGARHRLLAVLPVAAVLGLGAVVAAGHALGVEYPARLGALVAVSGLAVWRLLLHVQTWPRLGQLLGVLGLGGGYLAPGGRWWVETYIYWSSFALVLLGVGVDLWQGQGPGALSGVSWPVFLAASVFLIVAGYHYERTLNTYLFVLVTCFAAVSVFVVLRGVTRGAVGDALPLGDLSLGLVLAFVSASASVVALLCRRHESDHSPVTARLEVLYGWPLRHCSAGLALLVLVQVLVVTWVSPPAAGWTIAPNLMAASAILFWVNRTLLLPVLTGVAALAATFGILWLSSLIPGAHPPTELWPGGGARAEPSLVLAVLTSCLATVGYWFEKRSRWRDGYGIPLLWVAGLVYGWCLAGAVSLYPTGSAYLPFVIAVLTGALFPLLRPLRSAVALRGIAVALLLTFLATSAVGFEGQGEWAVRAALGWGFVLWGLGIFVLPRLNPTLQKWGMAPQSWPWLGLAVLFFGLGSAYQPGEMHWGLSLCGAVYMFLMLRQSRWPVFPWLGVVALTLGVVLSGIEYLRLSYTGSEIEATGLLAFHNLLWANALLGCLPLWRRYGEALGNRLGWIQPALPAPLLFTALVVCVAWLLGLMLWDGLLIFLGSELSAQGVPGFLLGALLCLSLFHAYANWPRGLSAHLLATALVTTMISAWAVWQPFHLPLAVVIVGVVLAAWWSFIPSTTTALPQPLRAALGLWMRIVPAAGVGCLLLMFEIPLSEQLAALGLLAGTAAFTGWRERNRIWLIVALAFAALLLHGIWLLWVPWHNVIGLLPAYALQFALIGVGLRGLKLLGTTAGGGSFQRWLGHPFIRQLLRDMTRAAIALSTAEWGLYLLVFAVKLVSDLPELGLEGWMSTSAALATGLILATTAAMQAVRSRYEKYWYLAAAMLGLTAVYGRVLWVGLAPLSVWDTGAIIVTAYAMFALQFLTRSRAALHLNMVLPLAALVTVPLQFHSASATLSLFAIGALYLLTCRTSGRATPLYLGLLAINAGIYLWLPDWAQQFGLLQLYVIPAALSVLLLVHLHRAELRSNVVNGARLAALSTIFGAAVLDVFLQESLGIFVLALALSLAGVIVGIVTRTRAFLYAGLAFLIINVLGQLLQLYPEQRLGRALLLMSLGATITAAMIWFNLKREAIMDRLRLIRADLATWD